MSTSRSITNTNNDHNEELLFSFLPLPAEIKKAEVYPHLGSLISVFGVLAQTSKQYEAKTAFSRLLTAAVDAEPESYNPKSYRKNKVRLAATPKSHQIPEKTRLASITLLKRHPELLFREGTVTDHFGRKIQASPYRLLLGAGDVWALKQVHVEIIAKMEDQEARTNTEAQVQAEFQTQFPDYNGPWPLPSFMFEEALYDARNRAQIEQVKAQLKIVVEKIKADPCTKSRARKNETTKAVADLCNIFAPNEDEIIKTGLHFPLGILKELEKSYVDQFRLWSNGQLAFFSREVIGGAEAALSAVDGQNVKNGLINRDMSKGPDRRDGLFCQHPRGIPSDKAPLVGKLGRTMFVDPYGNSYYLSSTADNFVWYEKSSKRAQVSWWGAAEWVDERGCGFSKLMAYKSSAYGKMMQPNIKKSKHLINK